MAKGDMTFALKVEETLKDVSPPEYRQIVVEVNLLDDHCHIWPWLNNSIVIAVADGDLHCLGETP